MGQVSVIIITKDEELYIAEAIESAKFADEVVILDSGSTDKTCDIARDLGAKVYHHEWLGFGAQKNKAVSLAKNDWVFVLDADERITKELSVEINKLSAREDKENAFYVARLNYFFGKAITSCGLYPDYSIRFFNRKKGQFNNVQVHESVQTEGKVGVLNYHMIHFAYNDISEFIDKQNKYSSLNKKKNKYNALFSPVWTFFKLFIIKQGFRDGWTGFLISVLYAQYTFWKYIK